MIRRDAEHQQLSPAGIEGLHVLLVEAETTPASEHELLFAVSALAGKDLLGKRSAAATVQVCRTVAILDGSSTERREHNAARPPR